MTEMAVASVAGAESAERPRREFLTCRLVDEVYGIDILRVQEIRQVDRVTRVPHVAGFTRGVINLRGAIVPIVDLGLMFGFGQPIALEQASAIILTSGQRLVGLVVSGVSDVIALADDEIKPAPDLGGRAIASAISGIGVAESGTVLLLDVDHLLQRIREERE
jgi:purine-binding chemotaxis protein CheW